MFEIELAAGIGCGVAEVPRIWNDRRNRLSYQAERGGRLVRGDDLERRVRAAFEELDRAGLRRTLRAPSGIDFSSNDYLGLATHPLLKQRMAAAVCEHGCGSTGSRLLRGERDCFSLIEQRFAEFKGTERALYFSSGYLANLAVLTTFPEAGDVIFSDERNHASLIDGARLSRARRVIFPHNDVAALRRLMGNETGSGQKFVVAESVFSVDGDFAPLREYGELCCETGAALIADEAHAVGIYGERGQGLGDDVFVSVNTAGKALGVAGAFVTGPEWAIEFLAQRARPFIFSTAPPPAVAAALDASLDVIEGEPERRERLIGLASYLRRRLGVPGTSQIIPVVLGSNERAMAVALELQHQGFDVRAIRPPTVPEGTARLRISVNVNLSESVMDRFGDRFADALCAASL
ncbi:MAG TPA: 8-amino-7-oxononanoate synthase [Bryobacteraceae bacterium]